MQYQRLNRLLLLTALLLLAAFLRIYRLDTIPNGLLPDEAMRGYDAYALLQTGADSFGTPFPLFLRGFDDYTPALYSYLAAPFIAIFGLSALGARLASAFAGVVTVALAYQLIRRPFGPGAALIGAFLLAISPWHILPSRAGAEWNLLSLGPSLVIVLAYRGLRRPFALIAAGIAAGLSLYGYAPIKAFLPLLMLGFVVFYRQELRRQKRAALVALFGFIVIATPIYIFSFTPQGMQRFSLVYEGANNSILDVVPRLIGNYFAYFSPKFFILSQYSNANKPALEIAHLRSAGLLSWSDLGLIVLGVITVFFSKKKSAWFILFWLIISPVGINLHVNSPWPILWLTAIPMPQALAAAGIAWLFALAKNQGVSKNRTVNRWAKPLGAALLLTLTVMILINFGRMAYDLFYQFPTYGARAWAYGTRQSILAMQSVEDQFDEVNLAFEDLSTAIFLLFHTRYDPARRQADLALTPGQTWQNIGDYNIGNVRQFIQQPGCHLILTSVPDAQDLQAHNPHLMTLQQIKLPTGQAIAGLYALPVPSTTIVEQGVIFGDSLMLQGFAPVSPLNPEEPFRPGKAICLILQWQALDDVSTDYTVFAHLAGPVNPQTNATIWSQHDSPPNYGARPTSGWKTGDTIRDAHILITPSNLPAGRYTLEVGLYNPLTGQRLPARHSDGQIDDKVVLMELAVSGQ